MKLSPIFVLVCSLALPASAMEMAGNQGAPAGEYTLEKSHASLIFRINHLGFSMFTARFLDFDAKLTFDPAAPQTSKLKATVNTASIETDFPTPEVVDFNKELQQEAWLNTERFPTMTYSAESVEMTGADTGRILGQLTLLGVTKPVVLEARFNGGYPGMSMDPNARIGFSARGTLQRSDFGMTTGIPAAGSSMGVGDEVEVIIEAEFSGPAWQSATAEID
jgi:polyisoprenoid-binding protein YceI